MKRLFAMILAVSLCLSLCIPASATSNFEDVRTINSEDAFEKSFVSSQKTWEKDTYNEYDQIIRIRSMTPQERNATGLSLEQIKYICSDAIEHELLYRASLPDNELTQHYCYTSKQIRILRSYNGEPLEESPQMREVSATMSTTVGALVYTSTRMGISYAWTWSSKPTLPINNGNDIVAAAWEGTYAGGASNNAALDGNSSFMNVIYHFSPTATWTETKMITASDSNNVYGNCSKDFEFKKSINTYPVWSKSGCLFLYVNLVNLNANADFVELAVHFAYGHSTLTINPGVAFPPSLGISFSTGVTTYGNRNVRMDTSGCII